MINKYETAYSGPIPKDINPNFPDHTYEQVVCLVNGETKRIIQDRYLQKFGFTKHTYSEKFPNAPFKSWAASDSYRNAAENDGGTRSKTMSRLNLGDDKFQEARVQGILEMWQTPEGKKLKKFHSDKAKKQHKDGDLDKAVQEYFQTDYKGSEDQKARSERMSGENNIIHLPGVIEKSQDTYVRNHNSGFHATRKRQFKNYDLQYQSSYEYHFLEYCEERGIIHLVSGPKTLKDELYPRRYYLPDYVLCDKYIVEIKSWYIEKKQLEINPNVTNEKQSLVERLGYEWLYILDKNYSALADII